VEPKCYGLDSIDDGVIYKDLFRKSNYSSSFEAQDHPKDVDPGIWTYYFCKTKYEFIYDDANALFQCRKGARNHNQNRMREMAGEKCKYTKYDDPSSYKPIEGENLSSCGFNYNKHAYCPMLKGDDDVLDAIEADEERIKKGHSDLRCHPLSGTRSGICAQYSRSSLNTTEKFNLMMKLRQASSLSSHLVADNDECVAASITQQFWYERFPGRNDTLTNNEFSE